VALWYNHTYGDWRARLAFRFADKVFHTSPYAFSAGMDKSERMPAGIDTDRFKPLHDVARTPHSILYVGRIAPVKRVHILFDAFDILKKNMIKDATLMLAGTPRRKDANYLGDLKLRAEGYGKDVTFLGGVANRAMAPIYNAATVTVNLTPKGNYDKTVLESMSCETIVALSSEAFADAVPSEFTFKEGDAASLAERLAHILRMSDADKVSHEAAMRRYVIENHDLGVLARRLATSMSSLIRK
jgi:glycosyltransferase involved in cell wall biosynthesis